MGAAHYGRVRDEACADLAHRPTDAVVTRGQYHRTCRRRRRPPPMEENKPLVIAVSAPETPAHGRVITPRWQRIASLLHADGGSTPEDDGSQRADGNRSHAAPMLTMD